MTDAFSAAMTTLFADPNMSVAATVWPGAASVIDGWAAADQDELAAGASGDPISLRAILSAADDLTEISGQGVHTRTPIAEIRVIDAPALGPDDVLQIGADYYVVIEKPARDTLGQTWTAPLRLGFGG